MMCSNVIVGVCVMCSNVNVDRFPRFSIYDVQ